MLARFSILEPTQIALCWRPWPCLAVLCFSKTLLFWRCRCWMLDVFLQTIFIRDIIQWLLMKKIQKNERTTWVSWSTKSWSFLEQNHSLASNQKTVTFSLTCTFSRIFPPNFQAVRKGNSANSRLMNQWVVGFLRRCEVKWWIIFLWVLQKSFTVVMIYGIVFLYEYWDT